MNFFVKYLETDPKFKAYYKDILKYPLLSREEEVALFKKAKGGCDESRKEIISANLRLAVKIASTFYKADNISFFDMVQEGNLGLLEACERFDVSKNFKFSTYATFWIRKKIIDFLYLNINVITKSIHLHAIEEKLNNSIIPHLKKKHNREPTSEEISSHSGYSKKVIERASSNKMTYLSNFDLFEEDSVMVDGLSDDFKKVLVELNHLEEVVIRLFFGII